ncbi:hypothetical protein [Chondromyces crocatus]|nr:hypothetical protein [Chondromyces crocatus]
MQPDPGEMHIDASSVVLKFVDDADLPRMLKLRDKVDKAMDNILVLTPAQIAQAGLNVDDMDRLRANISDYRKVSMFLAAARQMAENLQQTSFCLGHEIAAQIGEISSQARRRARVSPARGEILNALTHLIDYQVAPAKKGLATKAKAKKSSEQGAGQAAVVAPIAKAAVRAEEVAEQEEAGPASVAS